MASIDTRAGFGFPALARRFAVWEMVGGSNMTDANSCPPRYRVMAAIKSSALACGYQTGGWAF